VKAFLTFLLAVGVASAAVWAGSPATARAFASRVTGFFSTVPDVPGPPHVAAPRAAVPAAPAPAPWRGLDREASSAYDRGNFSEAASLWTEAAGAAPPNEVPGLKARANRARIYALLAEGAHAAEARNSPEDDAEVRRRILAVSDPTAGAWLQIAEYAAAQGLLHRLPYLYDRAFERKQDGTGTVDRAVAAAYRKKKEKPRTVPLKAVSEAILEELPAGEAAEEAAEDRGGIGGIAPAHGEGETSSADSTKLAEARKEKRLGDAELGLVVPGNEDANKHRRAALEHYRPAQVLYEELSRGSGGEVYGRVLTEVNRRIAEIRKDLPISK